MRRVLTWIRVAAFAALFVQPLNAARAQDADIVSDPPASAPAEEATVVSAIPEPLAPAEDQALLDEWFRYLGANARRARVTSGATSLIGSSIVMGLGIALYVQEPYSEVDKGLGLAGVLLAGAGMSLGIVQLASKSAAEKTLARWNDATSADLSAHELARFEGELRRQVDAARAQLLAARWTSFGLAMGGALLLGLTPAANLSTDGATVGYVGGGVFLGVGLLNFAMTFRKAANPDYWNAYLQGQRPPIFVKSWSASPAFGHHFAGVQFGGTF